MPKIWGLHDYSDVNRFESWRTAEIDRALGGQVWLTETGGIVQFGSGFPNRNGSGLTRAASVVKFVFARGPLPFADRAPLHLRLDRGDREHPLRRRPDQLPRSAAARLRRRVP